MKIETNAAPTSAATLTASELLEGVAAMLASPVINMRMHSSQFSHFLQEVRSSPPCR